MNNVPDKDYIQILENDVRNLNITTNMFINAVNDVCDKETRQKIANKYKILYENWRNAVNKGDCC